MFLSVLHYYCHHSDLLVNFQIKDSLKNLIRCYFQWAERTLSNVDKTYWLGTS